MARTEQATARAAAVQDRATARPGGAGQAVQDRATARPGGAGQAVPLLFLISDTGGGHRSAAVAVRAALDRAYPGRFAVTLCDPLAGADASRLLRWVAGLYGPVTRRAPWLWGAAYYLTNSRPAAALLGATLFRLADEPVARAVAAQHPAAIVSFHPLTGLAAVRAADHLARDRRSAGPALRTAGQRDAAGTTGPVPVVTVVTDLGSAHAAWRFAGSDLAIVPPGQAAADWLPAGVSSGRAGQGWRAAGARASQAEPGGAPHRTGRNRAQRAARVVRAGPPAGREFWGGPLSAAGRAAVRRKLGPALGLREDGLLIVLAGGGEGCGGIGRRALALARRFPDAQVVAVCGRNDRLRRRLLRRAARLRQAGQEDQLARGRLIVTGFTPLLPGLLRCADLVVTKAGPGTITEAACSGAPLLLTAQLPGQERGNAGLVTGAGAGRRVPGVRRLVAEVARLSADRPAVDGLRAASARLGRPADTQVIARLIADLAGRGPATGARLAALVSRASAVSGGGDQPAVPAGRAVLAGGGAGGRRG